MPQRTAAHIRIAAIGKCLAALCLLALSLTDAAAQEAPGAGPETDTAQMQDITATALRTESAFQTLFSLDRLTKDLEDALLSYERDRTARRLNRVVLLLEDMTSLLDLSQLPDATRRDVGFETLGHVLDILGRVDPIDIETVPDDPTSGLTYRIPGTPLLLSRVKEGNRAGEVLFDPQTVIRSPRFAAAIADAPLRSDLEIETWSALFGGLSGPLIPRALADAVPDRLQGRFLDTPLWKVIVFVLTTGFALLAFMAFRKVLHWHKIHNPLLRPVVMILGPVAFIAVIRFLHWFALEQLNTTGQLARVIANGATVLIYLAATIIIWQVVRFGFELMISRLDRADEDLDANMIRLIGQMVAVVVAVIVLAYGGQAIGLPVFSILAGLGIGGIAIALAIRPTLENLIGGFILYIDKPIRVGDFCTFSDQGGTIESIGVRSTQIRALDRTLITVPNAQFADMQLINWARCDMMMITHTLGLRYETDPDQLRHVLAKLREMMHGHPRIDSDTVRVRFAGYGASSLDIAIRVYATTREWNEFHAIREDVFLRVYDVVRQSGTGFAFPSQTLYMARDDGLDADLAEAAKSEVAGWRRNRSLPFPRFSAEKLNRLDGRLHYPGPGSPDFNATEEELSQGGESLSAAPLSEDNGATGSATETRKGG
ncbi:mechanosensitive ion channel family protein [Aliiruegeria sabulilitoris]|uniref:mechanosensitive ion channel family protein n=1 Tax=Aliiruegeria sabulilitoris TaxID=1510458 RepID=UPI0013D74618|nr:mechanosensitive ion channel family protein [Aliiruegeria sabulilitoris]